MCFQSTPLPGAYMTTIYGTCFLENMLLTSTSFTLIIKWTERWIPLCK